MQRAYFGHNSFLIFTTCSYLRKDGDLINENISIISGRAYFSHFLCVQYLHTMPFLKNLGFICPKTSKTTFFLGGCKSKMPWNGKNQDLIILNVPFYKTTLPFSVKFWYLDTISNALKRLKLFQIFMYTTKKWENVTYMHAWLIVTRQTANKGKIFLSSGSSII